MSGIEPNIMLLAAIFKAKFIDKGKKKQDFIDSLGELWPRLSEKDQKYILREGHKHVQWRIWKRKEKK